MRTHREQKPAGTRPTGRESPPSTARTPGYASAMLRLQQAVGNAAVQRMLLQRTAVGEAQAIEPEIEHSIERTRGGGSPHPGLQRQMVTPLGPGGGYGGVMERDRRRWIPTPPATQVEPAPRRIKTWFKTFIPQSQIPGPPGSECFTGDDRGFSNSIHASARTHQEIEFDVATLDRSIDWKHVGATHEVDCGTGAVRNTATAPTSQLSNGPVGRSGTDILVAFTAGARNPLVTLAPAIDLAVTFRVDPIRRLCMLTGQHDGFPGYEGYVTADGGAGVPVYSYDPRAVGETPTALFPPMDVTARGSWVRF